MCERDVEPHEAPPKEDAEGPAAPKDESSASRPDGLAEVNRTLLELRNLFEQQIARNQNQGRMFDATYREMKEYKGKLPPGGLPQAGDPRTDPVLRQPEAG